MGRNKLRIFWMLPPVILAALLIWLLVLQGDYGIAGEKEITGKDMKKEQIQETVSDIILYSEAKAGEQVENGEDLSVQNGQSGLDGELIAKSAETLLFAGDIYLSDHVLNAYDRAGGIEGVLDQEIRDAISRAGLFMANQEFPFSDRGTAANDKQFTFRLPPGRVDILKQIGPDIVALANNHALDYGTDALLDTCRILDEAGIRRAGAGVDLDDAKKPVFMELGDKTMGFLAASRVIPESGWAAGKDKPGMMITYDPVMLLEEIKKAREQCDYLVVYVHWGIEKNTEPEEYQRVMGKQYIDAGADLVVGSHPHVLQGIEYYNGKPIVYSLGNFVFGSSIPRTALLEVTLPGEGQSPGLRLLPCTSSSGYTRVLGEESRAEFFQSMEAISFGVSVDENGNVSQAVR